MTTKARTSKPRTTAKKTVPGAPGAYSFVLNGKAYALPPAAEAAPKVDAGVFIDAIEAGTELAEVRLGLAMLRAADIDKATMAALRALPMDQFGTHLQAWMTQTGANPGK